MHNGVRYIYNMHNGGLMGLRDLLARQEPKELQDRQVFRELRGLLDQQVLRGLRQT